MRFELRDRIAVHIRRHRTVRMRFPRGLVIAIIAQHRRRKMLDSQFLDPFVDMLALRVLGHFAAKPRVKLSLIKQQFGHRIGRVRERVAVVRIVAMTEMEPVSGKERQRVTTLMVVEDGNIDRPQNRAQKARSAVTTSRPVSDTV